MAGVPTGRTRAHVLDPRLVGLGAAGLLLGVVGGWAFFRAGASPVDVGRHLVVGWLFIGGGLIAWRRWPDNACSRLVLAEGFALFMPDLRGSGNAILFALGTVLSPFNDMILVHLVFAYPSGRVGGWQRGAVVAGYASALAFGTVSALIDSRATDWSSIACSQCRVYAMLRFPGGGAFWGVTLLGAAMAGAAALATVALTVRTWAVSTAAARQISAARWLAWAFCAAMIAIDAARNVPLPLSAAGWVTVDWVGELSQLAIPLVLALGAVRIHAAGAAVGGLLADLDRRVSHAALAETLARTLHDPSLQLLVWRPESAGYVDAQGRAAFVPTGDDGRVTRVVTGAGQPLAAIVHDRALADLPELVSAARAATRLGLENERLRAQLEAQLLEAHESRERIVEAADAARRETERDLHDGAQQRLLSLGLLLDRLEEHLRGDPGPAGAVAAEAGRQLRTALAELRELARGIHPAILSQAGLAGALPSLAERAPLVVRVAVRCGRCRPSVEMTVYLVASEGLANIAKHARASRASVCVDQRDGCLVVEIADDGVGGADLERGSGLRGLADRVAAHGGTLQVDSPPGGGTRITAELPCG